jgi:hypothetical protein
MRNEFTLELPAEHRVLSVQPQHGKYQMWILNDLSSEMRPCHFCLVGTGQELPTDRCQYIATLKQYDDRIVLHLFEKDRAV